MPAGNVVIDGTFSQTPVKSAYLEILNVNVNSTITPNLEYLVDKYTAKIPHIYPTDPNQKFSIIAIPEDPNADVSIYLPGDDKLSDAGGEFPLNEGKSEYTIKVSRTGAVPDTNTYNFTVDYEPDLSLKSITLSSSEDETEYWTHTIPVQDGQTITIPYDSVTIAAIPNDDKVALAASLTGGKGNFSTDEPGSTWTLAYSDIQNTYSVKSTVNIKSTKNISNSGNYEKDFNLQFEKIVDADWPASYWATSTGEGNGVSIIKEGDEYYEIHTFTVDGTLTVNSIPDEGLTAHVLVVAGGGGGGSAVDHKDHGGGGGGGGVGYSENVSLEVQDYAVVVGVGGIGSNGGDSSFESITVEGGGKGGIGTNVDAGEAQKGGNGGSGGGGGAGAGSTRGNGGSANTHAAVTGYQFFGSKGDNGNGNDVGATTDGGNGGSANFFNDISGTSKEYGKGGIGGGLTGNTPAVNGSGNGGNGAVNTSGGGNGSSGIVIVRFPARLNDTAGGGDE
jgi:hypothetical protein